MIVVINYGMGNLRSIEKALTKLNADFKISNKKEDMRRASRLILPGVGAFGEGMKNLRSLKLIDVLREEVLEKKKPILGICLGMQLLFGSGEEGGETEGIGLVSGKVIRFNLLQESKLKVPHIGWNSVFHKGNQRIKIFEKIEEESNFYFVHSYHCVIDDKVICAFTNHCYDFVSAFQKENVFGTQFHPEKSQTKGLALLKNFISL